MPRRSSWTREGITRWDFGALPAVVRVSGAALDVPGYPVLRDTGEAVATETFTDAAKPPRVHRAGVRRLLLLDLRAGRRTTCAATCCGCTIGLRWGPRFDRAR